MAGASNMEMAMMPMVEAYILRLQYTDEAAHKGYESIAAAVSENALPIPLDEQHIIHYYPHMLLAFGPNGAPTTEEEHVEMKRVMMGSKVHGDPCKYWMGVDLRTLSPEEIQIHHEEMTKMLHYLKNYSRPSTEQPTTLVAKEILDVVVAAILLYMELIESTSALNRRDVEAQTSENRVDLQHRENLAKGYDHPQEHFEPYPQIVPGPGNSEASSARISSQPISPSPTGSNGGREDKKTRGKGPDAWLKAIYGPRIKEMRANPNTRVVFQAKLTTQGLLEDFVKHKGLGAPPRTEQAAKKYLAAQSQSFKTSFEFYRAERELYWKRTESKCTFHAWREAERGHALGRKRQMLRKAARARGDNSVIPHPAGEDRIKPRPWL